MRILQETFSTKEQYFRTIEFLKELGKIDEFMYWDPGRMNFWRHSVHGRKDWDDPFFPDNTRLWTDGDKIVGLCISEYGKNDIFMEVHPYYMNIFPDMLKWVNGPWASCKDAIEIDVFSDNEARIKLLENNGFKFKCHYENRRFYDMDEVDLNYELEDGFTIKAFYEQPDYKNRVDLVKSAFNNEKYSEKNLKSIQSSADYKKELDLVVVSPEGLFAAYCIGWHDPTDSASGYIEPVGTHRDFRRRGFASAVIRECFKRLKEQGVKNVDISSKAEPDISNFLYDSLKPKNKKKILRYSKEVFQYYRG